MPLSDAEAAELKHAKHLLENVSLAARMTDMIGSPIEKGFQMLPARWNKKIGGLAQAALLKATDAALYTMKDAPGEAASNRWHKTGVALSGGIGGFFGLAAISVELPISTTLMLRSIADIARSEGESLADPATKIACLEVFALGGNSKDDDALESSYYTVRAALAQSVSDAVNYVAQQGGAQHGAPMLVKFVSKVAERFGIQVTEKAAAQAVPMIGAASGALINTLFIDHFQDMAKGHFTVRRLERLYGKDVIKRVYDAL